jgi:DHA3 family macrolide efflux protein-like MFS transporter
MMVQRSVNRGFMVFIIIWLGHVTSALGSQLTSFALGVWVFERTGSATHFALISMFSMLPGILILPLAGTLVDRCDRRKVLILSDTVAALVTLGAAGLLYGDHLEIWHIYLFVMINSLSGAFFQPAFMASITLLVPGQHYGRANGLVQSGFATAQIVAPALAGILVLTVHLWGVLLIDFITFLVAVTVLFLVHIPNPQKVVEGKAGQKGLVKQEAALGWKYIAARPGLVGLLVFFAMTNFSLGIVQVLITPLVLGFANAAVLGRVLSAAGVGTLLGGIVMSAWGGPRQRVYGVLSFTLLQGLILLLGGLRPSALLIAAAAAIVMFSAQIINGCSQSIWQSKTPPDIQGRVFAIRTMIAWSSLPVAYLVAGPAADYVFEPLLTADGSLASSVGQIIGVGPGRGIGLLYIVLGTLVTLAVSVGYLHPRLRLLESELPDAVVKDVPPQTHQGQLVQERLAT